MLRAFLSTLCVFALAGSVAAAEKKEDKKGTTVSGKYDSYKDGKLTILVGKGDDAKPQTFEVKDDAKIQVFSATAEKPSETAAGDAFKSLKAGAAVRVMIDAEKKITRIEVGDAPKKPKGDK